ncbi:MAG: molybdopterin-dependent oxidoreductase [Deltaproteobacteria bacterium]|nr:molybdopterin-dependent oxidoreductase [Nannocystaceae bacterium]
MTIATTRRGFLRGGMGAALVTTGCHPKETITGERAPESTPTGATPSERVRLSTTINGTVHELEVGPDDAALETVRALGLTGAKHGCGHGACGACAMQLDGTPVATCLLPATALAGRQVRTIEALGAAGLHPVQRAFMAEDALQCGYCTPGFVVEAAAFYDGWRAAHGNAEPSRDQVATALSGHLCRCGAYASIYRAVQGACAGRYEAEAGSPRVEAAEKVTGAAIYTVDVQMAGMLHAKSLHAPWAHARIRKIDWSKALALPGVRGAIDLLGDAKRVRYAGQEILAIAAVDERTAERAIELVDIDAEILPPLMTIAAATAPGAASIYPRGDRKAPNATEGPLIPEKWNGNVRGPLKLFSKHGDKANRAIEEARSIGVVAEGSYTTSVQCHTALEPHAAVALWDGEKRLRVYLSSQSVRTVAHDIAERWSLREEDVQVIAHHVGGGFGGKATLTTEVRIAVDLAKVCGAPVRYALDRRAEIMIGGNRPGASMAVALATDRAGELVGMRAHTHSTAGVAVGTVTTVLFRIIYPEAPRELVDYDVVTHAPPGKPMRGPGGPPAFFALEQTVDELAHLRGEDPLVMRKRWDPNAARKPLYTWAQAIPQWKDRGPVAADKGRFRRGVGVACASWFVFAEPRSRLQLELSGGELVASTSTQDIGNGVRTSIATLVAERFGVAPKDVHVRIGDSRYVHGPMSGGSRTTSSIAQPCTDACDQLQAELVEIASRRWKLRAAQATPKGVGHASGLMPWRDVMRVAPHTVVVGRRRRDQGGFFLPPIAGAATERYVAGAIQLTEVEVDTRLGHVRVIESWLGVGAGRIVQPTLARSQAEGGVVQGIGYALYEERRLDPKHGFLLTGGLEDYRIPGIGDIGPIHIHFDEHGYEKVPGHNVGLGELVTLTPAAAIGNAIFHATKWRPRELPIRPDRVLGGLRT